jgi:hypothetical protein
VKRVLCLLVSVLACSAAFARAQSMGTLTDNGVSLEVKNVVAVLDDAPSLVFYLLPFQPTADEVGKLQAGDILFWMSDKPSPDPKKWKTCPHGSFKLSWSFAKQSIGDPKKAFVFVASSAEGNAVTASRGPGEVPVSLTGQVKVGQEVTLTSKGSIAFDKGPVSWDLNVRTRVLASKPKQ